MKNKLIILTLCFTIVFSSINFKKSYADGGVVSLPILATVSALAVGTGIVINGNDDLYDICRLFYDYIDRHNDLTWSTVQSVFTSSVSFLPNKLVSVKSDFLDIIKGFFDNTFNNTSTDILFGSNVLYPSFISPEVCEVSGSYRIIKKDSSSNILQLYSTISNSYVGGYTFKLSGLEGISVEFIPSSNTIKYWAKRRGVDAVVDSRGTYNTLDCYPLYFGSITFPYNGGYTWDNVDSKKENESIALPIPGDLGQLVGQNSKDFWDNTNNLVGGGVISLPDVSNPSINLDGSTSFPSVDSDVGVVNPSLPNDGIWSTIKDFIIGLVVPSDTFWTDTWGGLYNNFTDSFPMVDMSGFDDLVTGEKKFPNIDINIMGITGRVVNGDVINSIVDWLRPIIAGFMMICLMLFNYRKIYKLIRNTEPFGGIAPGTSDFKTGISEYTHVGLVNDGFKRSEEEEFARSRYYEEMHFRNGGKL